MNPRAALRRVLRDVTLTRRLPSGSRVVLSPASQLKHLKPGRAGFDENLLDWAQAFVRPGMSVWDIGANLGCFAFSAADHGGKVLAVEPDPYLVHLLMRSRALSPGLPMELLSACVADHEGMASLQIASGGRAANTLMEHRGKRAVQGEIADNLMVPMTTLDALMARFGAPDLIKIDVEGAESAVLRGGEAVLAAGPVLLLETGDETSAEIGTILTRHGYEMFDLELAGRPRIETPTFSTLAIRPRPDGA